MKSLHFSIGQGVALALLGLSAYHNVESSPEGLATFLNPTITGPFIQGVIHILTQQPQPIPPPVMSGKMDSPVTEPAGLGANQIAAAENG